MSLGFIYDADGLLLKEGTQVERSRNHEGPPFTVLRWDLDESGGGTVWVEDVNGKEQNFPVYGSYGAPAVFDLVAY